MARRSSPPPRPPRSPNCRLDASRAHRRPGLGDTEQGSRLPWQLHLAWLALAGAPAWAQPDVARPPNVVILYADDMGYGDLAAQNPDSKIPTPNLDRLVREGMRFTDAHSSSGICTPSRYALLTGQHHWRRFHEIVGSFGASVIPRQRLTMPAMFARHGYHTACIGKWHLGWDWRAIMREGAHETVVDGKKRGYPADAFDWSKPIPDGPLAHGFDHYFGDDVPNFPPYAWIEDDRVLTAPTLPFRADPTPGEGVAECRPGPMVEGWKLDDVMPRLTDAAVEWLRGRKDSASPFFLYFPWTSPHAPIVPSAAFAGKSKAGPYGDYVVESDTCAGRILDALDELDLAGDTIVVFTADNGPEHYAHERVRRFEHRSMGPLRGLKRDVWEGGHRVPFVVRWPGKVHAGSVCDALVGQVDLMATFAAVLGHALPDDAAEDSFDCLALWRGEVAQVREFLVHNTYADRWAIRRGRWVLLEPADGTHTRVPPWFADAEGYEPLAGKTALFDLTEDLGQRRDVVAEHAEVARDLHELLQRVRQQGHSAPRLAK
ncbi:MAG: arylsulfatase [Planctomycetota bacterium]